LSLAVVSILTRGYVPFLLKWHVSYSTLYKTFLAKRYLIVPFYKNAVGVFKRFRFRQFTHEFFENPVYMTVSAFPAYLAVLVLWGMSGFAMTPLLGFVLAGLLFCLIIATEPLKFFGQPDRYIEYCVAATFAWLSQYPVSKYWWLLAVCFAIELWGVAFHFKINSKWAEKNYDHLDRDYDAMERQLTELPESMILSIPSKISHYFFYKTRRHHYAGFFIAPESNEVFQYLMPDRYTYPGADLKGYIDQYAAQYILLHKNAVPHMEKQMGHRYYDFSPFRLVYENETLALYHT